MARGAQANNRTVKLGIKFQAGSSCYCCYYRRLAHQCTHFQKVKCQFHDTNGQWISNEMRTHYRSMSTVCVCVGVCVRAQKGFISWLNLFNAFSCGCAGKRSFQHFSSHLRSISILYLSLSLMRTIELILFICTTKIHAVNLNFDDIQWIFWMNECPCVWERVYKIKRGPENHYSFGFCAGFSCQLWFPIQKIIEYTGDYMNVRDDAVVMMLLLPRVHYSSKFLQSIA